VVEETEAKSKTIEFTAPTYITRAETRKDSVRFELKAPDELNAAGHVTAILMELEERFGKNPPATARQDVQDTSKIIVEYTPRGGDSFQDTEPLSKALSGAGIPNGEAMQVTYAMNALNQLNPDEKVRTMEFFPPAYLTKATIQGGKISFETRSKNEAQATGELGLVQIEARKFFGSENPVTAREEGKDGAGIVVYDSKGRNSIGDTDGLIEAFRKANIANASEAQIGAAMSALLKLEKPELAVVGSARSVA